MKFQSVFLCLLAALAACADTESSREIRLLRAARNGETKAVARLLDLGADIETRNPGDGWTPLMWAAVRDQSACVKLLISRGAKVEARDRRGLTALMAAARWGKKDGVAALLEGGARVGAIDDNGWNALMWASFKGQSDMAAFLIAHGASLDARDPDGRTALTLASMKAQAKTVELLRARGAR